MTDRPILFNGPMVRALLDGQKTQTRRPMKVQPSVYVPGPNVHKPKHDAPYFDAYCGAQKTDLNPRGQGGHWCWWTPDDRQGADWIKCPYGVPGDRLWVRETWGLNDSKYQGGPIPAERPADLIDGGLVFFATEDDAEIRHEMPCRPSIHMPRWASRLTLEITDVRVERVQAISDADAEAEGIRHSSLGDTVWAGMLGVPREICPAKTAFAILWMDVYGQEGWIADPWTWVVDFRVVERAAP
jgi:hypothetical protein